MRMVKFCMVLLCAAILTTAMSHQARSEMMEMPKSSPMLMMPGGHVVPAPSPMQQGDTMMMHGMMPMMPESTMMMPADKTMPAPSPKVMVPTEKPPFRLPGQTGYHEAKSGPYTSPNGIMKHYPPQQPMMMYKRQMMEEGVECCQGMSADCPKMQMKMRGMTPPKSCCGGANPDCPMMKMRKQMAMQPMQDMQGMPSMDDIHGMMRQGMMSQEMMMLHDKMAKGKKCGPDCPIVQSESMGADMMDATPMYHNMMHSGTMHRNMMMQQGVPFSHKMQRMPMMEPCTMCSKIYTTPMSHAMRSNLMNTLTGFDVENHPLYTQLMQLRQQHMMMSRMATTSPAQKAALEQKREQVRKALMNNLKKQSAELKAKFNMDITPREFLIHHMHQHNMMMPMDSMHMRHMHRTTSPRHMMMQKKQAKDRGYRSPQSQNPQYNQNYLENAPMREAYTGQTYE